MNENEMVGLLEKQLQRIKQLDVDVSGDQQFFDVGEWLLAFEGIYVANQRYPDALNQEEIKALVDYFGVDMSELDP
jgi:hypothetical protein